MNKEFNQALITGASSGIGMALARLLASKGISLIITGRDEKRLLDLARELPVEVQTIAADLAKPNDRTIVVAAIRQRKPQLVINNAGLGIYGLSVERDIQQQTYITELNVCALQELTLEAAKTLKEAGLPGVILNVSSAAAFQVFPYFAVYSSTKAFVNQLSLSLDYELRPFNIRVLAACPGVVATNFRKRSGGTVSDWKKSRLMTPEYAADQIWDQIKKREPIRIFNWKYRFLTFLSKFIPENILAPMLMKQIKHFTK